MPLPTSSDPPRRLLLCLAPEHYGDFYYPLAEGETVLCPHDASHAVELYASTGTVAGLATDEPEEEEN